MEWLVVLSQSPWPGLHYHLLWITFLIFAQVQLLFQGLQFRLIEAMIVHKRGISDTVFPEWHVHIIHAGDKALAEDLTIVLRSRDPVKLRSEVAPNKKVFIMHLCFTNAFITVLICLKSCLDNRETKPLIHFTYSLTGEGCYWRTRNIWSGRRKTLLLLGCRLSSC